MNETNGVSLTSSTNASDSVTSASSTHEPKTPSPPVSKLGWNELYWTPYVALIIVLIVLACASFLHYHRKHRGKYKDVEYKRKNNINTTPKKYRVTLNRKGRVVCTQSSLVGVMGFSPTEAEADKMTSAKSKYPMTSYEEDSKGLNGIPPNMDIFTVCKEPLKKNSARKKKNGVSKKSDWRSRLIAGSTSSNDDSGVCMEISQRRAKDKYKMDSLEDDIAESRFDMRRMSDASTVFGAEASGNEFDPFDRKVGNFHADRHRGLRRPSATCLVSQTSQQDTIMEDIYSIEDTEEPV